MNNRQRARFLGFKRVAAFGAEYAADMAPEAPARKPTKSQTLFAALGAPEDIIDQAQPPSVIGILGRAEITQLDGEGGFRAGTDNRAAQRKEVRRLMQRLREAAITIGEEQGRPALRREFAIPKKVSNGALAGAAQKFIDSAQALRTELLELQFEEDFLETMQARVVAFEAARAEQQSGRQNRTGARSTIDQQIRRGAALVRRLKVLMKNQYAGDEDMLAKWKSAVRPEKPVQGRSRASRKPRTAAAPDGVASAILPLEPAGGRAADMIEAENDRSVSLNGTGAMPGDN